jgi:carbon storage regulator
MLVLGAKIEQKIYIGPDIVVTVLRIDGQSVRLGFTAPQEVRIDREEVKRKRDAA